MVKTIKFSKQNDIDYFIEKIGFDKKLKKHNDKVTSNKKKHVVDIKRFYSQ